jgi:uncharacterized DUF497 family protein
MAKRQRSVEWDFEWDEEKAASNLVKHGVDFLTAAAIFENERIEWDDDREDYGETRTIAIGRADAGVYRVVYTQRGPKLIRIINAKRAKKDERETYYRQIYG